MGNFEVTKPLPLPQHTADVDDDDEVFVHEFCREDVRELIHTITKEIKVKGTRTPLVFLSFRPQVNNQSLTEFLAKVFPSGAKPAHLKIIEKAVSETDELTLVAALKYLWARLPGNCVVGWDSYETFKKLEAKDNYSKKAFLEFMPQCLSSPSHSSLVYDFLELLVALGGDSKANQLSGRKIAKMAGIWAFQGPPPRSLSLNNLEPFSTQANSFTDGLNDWLPAAGAMFHLLLSFLRSMLPEDVNTKLQLPRALQALLASNAYPPPDVTFSSSTLVHIPLVTIRTNSLSKSPIELINKVPKVLSFENQSLFEAKEDYALLKSLCRSDDNILNKLSGESRRIIEALCHKEHPSNLNAGWNKAPLKNLHGPTRTEVTVSRVSIDDYFIWAWLATISFEQTSKKKNLFGRALISEVVFDGFKKWIIIEEQNIDLNIRNSKAPSQDNSVIKTMHQPMYTSMLDGLPSPSPELRSKKPSSKPKPKPLPLEKKDKPLPEPIPANDTKSRSILNTFKKLNQNHQNYKKDQYLQQQQTAQPRPPVLPKKDSFKLEPIEGLPEIERDQYRLSIPLDNIGLDFEDDEYSKGRDHYIYDLEQGYDHQPQEYQYDQYQEQLEHQQQQYRRRVSPTGQRQESLNANVRQNQYQYHGGATQSTSQHYQPQYQYQFREAAQSQLLDEPQHEPSSMLSPQLPANREQYISRLRPEPLQRPVDEIKKAVSNYSDPNFTPSQSQDFLTSKLKSYEHVNSEVSGLTNLVDQIKLHVNDVEKSLEGSRGSSSDTATTVFVPTNAAEYEVEVPLPLSESSGNDYRREVDKKVGNELYGNGKCENVESLAINGKQDNMKKHYKELPLPQQQILVADAPHHFGEIKEPVDLVEAQPQFPTYRRKPHIINASNKPGNSDVYSSATGAPAAVDLQSKYTPTPNISIATPKENFGKADANRSVSGYTSMIDDLEHYSTPASTVHASPARDDIRQFSPVKESRSPPQRKLPSSPKKQYVDSIDDTDYPGDDFIDTYRAPSVYFQKAQVPADLGNGELPDLPTDPRAVREIEEADRSPGTAIFDTDKKFHFVDGFKGQDKIPAKGHNEQDSVSLEMESNRKLLRSSSPVSNSNKFPRGYEAYLNGNQQNHFPLASDNFQNNQQQHLVDQRVKQQHLTPTKDPHSSVCMRQDSNHCPDSQVQEYAQPSHLIQDNSPVYPQQVERSAPSPSRAQTSPQPKLSVQGRTELSPVGKSNFPPHQDRREHYASASASYIPHQQLPRGQMAPNRSMTSETSPYRGRHPARGPPSSDGSLASGSYNTPNNGSSLSLSTGATANGSSRRQSPQYHMNFHHQVPSPNRARSPQQPAIFPPPGAPNANYYPPTQLQQQKHYYPPPPQLYYPPPPQGYPAYPPQGYHLPQGYYPPPPQQQQYMRPPGSAGDHGASAGKPTGTASDFAIGNQPAALGKNKLHHNTKGKKKDLRNALTQGDFGI